MSLDVYLKVEEEQIVKAQTGAYVRQDGAIKQLDVDDGQEVESTEVYWANITHNLSTMAKEAGIYDAMWRPEENGIEKAGQLIPILEEGLATLFADPARFEQFNPENEWGDYKGLCGFVTKYLEACKKYPLAKVRVSR